MDINSLIEKYSNDVFRVQWENPDNYYILRIEYKLDKPRNVRGNIYEWAGKTHVFYKEDEAAIEKCIKEVIELQNGNSSTKN